MRFIYNTDLNN